jgi:serine/threonine protein kinase
MSVLENVRNVIRSSIFNADNPTGKLPPNAMLQQRYIIVQKVGKGGMGAVYEAVDTRIRNRHVAIKEMSQAKLSPEDRLLNEKQFQDEADMLSRLSHEHLPKVYEAFQERNRSYMVMDFIHGETLLSMLQKFKGSPLPFEQVLHYALQLCDVLMYLHQQTPPVIFRDLKPANVMIDSDANIFLIDFGIARLLKEDQSVDTRIFLSEGYAAPEQYGLPSLGISQTTAQSDLYSLGATLHHCLTAKRPLGIADAFRFAPVSKYNPQVPKQLDPFIQRLVEHDPQLRPASAWDVKQELNAMQKDLAANKVQGPLYLGKQHPFGSSPPINDTATVGASYTSIVAPAMEPAILHWLSWLGTIITGVITGLLTAGFTALFKLFWKAARSPHSPLPKAVQFFHDAKSGTLFASDTWQPGFVLLLCALLVGLLGSSTYAFTLSNKSMLFTAFCLSLILLLVTLIIGLSKGIQDPLPRNLLLLLGVSALISCVVLQTNSSVQAGITKVLHGQPVGQLFILCVGICAFISLLRTIFRWDNWFEWAERATAFGFVVVCMLLQSTLGVHERVPFLSRDTFPLAATSIHVFPLNFLVTLSLLLVAILLLCPITPDLSTLERFLLFLCAIVFSWQQLSFGEVEVQHWFPRAGSQLIVSVNQGIALGIIVLGLFLLARYRRLWVHPLILLAIALPCLLLQYVLSKQNTIPFLSPSGQQSNNTIYQLIVWGVCFAGLVLLVRLRRKLHWVDRILIFIIACVCALLQYSFGESEMMHMHLSSYNFEQSPFSLLQVIGLNHVLVAGLVLAAILMLSRWTRDEFTGVDRIVLICLPISAAILQFLFGSNEQFLVQNLVSTNNSYSFNVILSVVLVLIALFALLRIKRSFNGWDRLALVICAGSCLLLIWNNTDAQQLPQLSTNIQQLEENTLQITTLYSLVAIIAILDAVLSFIWLKRPFSQKDRKILQIVFGVSLTAAILQLFMPFLLLVALSTLSLGILIATQMERMNNLSISKSQVRPWQIV